MQRRRQECLEKWQNTPLEPAAAVALGGTSPETAWSDLLDLILRATDECYPEAEKAAKEMGLGVTFGIDMDLTDIWMMFSELNPIEGINQFNYLNPGYHLSEVSKKMHPLEALIGMIRILALSDRPISRDQWRSYF